MGLDKERTKQLHFGTALNDESTRKKNKNKSRCGKRKKKRLIIPFKVARGEKKTDSGRTGNSRNVSLEGICKQRDTLKLFFKTSHHRSEVLDQRFRGMMMLVQENKRFVS